MPAFGIFISSSIVDVELVTVIVLILGNKTANLFCLSLIPIILNNDSPKIITSYTGRSGSLYYDMCFNFYSSVNTFFANNIDNQIKLSNLAIVDNTKLFWRICRGEYNGEYHFGFTRGNANHGFVLSTLVVKDGGPSANTVIEYYVHPGTPGNIEYYDYSTNSINGITYYLIG